MVSDITFTYLWTDEGWLYIAAVMDLYGQIIVGLSMSERMYQGTCDERPGRDLAAFRAP